MSRRRNRSELVTIYWRDIPAQVTAQVGSERSQALMPDRFQVAIDRAAAVAGLTSTDDYVNEWRKVSAALEGDPAAAAQGLADELEVAHPEAVLEALVWSGGLASPRDDSPANDSPADDSPTPEQDPE